MESAQKLTIKKKQRRQFTVHISHAILVFPLNLKRFVSAALVCGGWSPGANQNYSCGSIYPKSSDFYLFQIIGLFF